MSTTEPIAIAHDRARRTSSLSNGLTPPPSGGSDNSEGLLSNVSTQPLTLDASSSSPGTPLPSGQKSLPSDSGSTRPTALEPQLSASSYNPTSGGNSPAKPYDEAEFDAASPKSRARAVSQRAVSPGQEADALHVAPVVDVQKVKKERQGGVKKVNRYRVLQLLGRGAYSKVKLCQHEVDHTFYAMKILSRSVLKSRGIGASSGLMKFRREVAILKRLRHPHIIALQEVIDDPSTDKLYLILELAEHRELVTLDDNNAVVPDEDGENKFPEKATRRLAVGLIDAVAFAHDNGIAHRDIKPQNILLTENNLPKLSDFGVSAIIDDSPLVTCIEGTISFLPPELLVQSIPNNDSDLLSSASSSWQGSFAAVPQSASFGTGQTPTCATPPIGDDLPGDTPLVDLFKADVWSLALTFFVVSTGHHPWPEAKNAVELKAAIEQTPMREVLKKLPTGTLSAELMDFIALSMEYHPEDRITIFQCKEHPWVLGQKLPKGPPAQPTPPPSHLLPSNRSSASDLTAIDLANAVILGKVVQTDEHDSPVAKATSAKVLQRDAEASNHFNMSGSSYPNSRRASVDSLQPLPSKLCVRHVPSYSAIHFPVEVNFNERKFAYDDSCVVQLNQEKLEESLRVHSLAVSVAHSLNASLVCSPHTTRPPSPTAHSSSQSFGAGPAPVGSPKQRRGVSPPADYAFALSMSTSQQHSPASGSPNGTASPSPSSPNGRGPLPATTPKGASPWNTPTLSAAGTPHSRKKRHTRSRSQPEASEFFSQKIQLMGPSTPNPGYGAQDVASSSLMGLPAVNLPAALMPARSSSMFVAPPGGGTGAQRQLTLEEPPSLEGSTLGQSFLASASDRPQQDVPMLQPQPSSGSEEHSPDPNGMSASQTEEARRWKDYFTPPPAADQ